jgi:hypothetical protein
MLLSPATPQTLRTALDLLGHQENPRAMLQRIETMARWCCGEGATPAMFTFHMEPLNALVTLAIHDVEAWDELRRNLGEHRKATWKGRSAQDRTEYMREYMREYRARAIGTETK